MSELLYKRPDDLHLVVGISSKYKQDYNYKFIKCDNETNMRKLISGGDIKLKNGKTYQSYNCFEIITKTTPLFYIDIDYKDEPVSIETFEKQLDTLNTILKDKVKDVCLDRLIYIREEEDKTMIKSAHIIYYKCCMKKTEQKQLVLYIQDYIKKIDPKVYGSNNLFCLPHNTKFQYNNKRKLIPYDDYTRCNNLIDNYLLNNTKNTILLEYTPTYVKEIVKEVINKCVCNINIEKDTIVEKLIEVLPNEFYNNNFLWKYLLKYLYTENCDYGLFMEHSAKITNRECSNEIIQNYINKDLKNLKLNPNFIFHKIAKQYNILFNYNPFTDEFILYCENITGMSGLKQKFLEINEYNLTADIKTRELHYKQFTIKMYQEVILDFNKKTFYYYAQDHTADDSDYKKQSTISNINELEQNINEIEKKIIFIKALWGSGKTRIIVFKILEKARQNNKKVLIVSENNSLNTELKMKLKNAGYDVVNHLDNDSDITDAQIQICSLESIHKIHYANVIILDEYETILSHFTSTTLNRNDKTDYTIFQKVKSLLQSAEKVICLDADISLPRVEWLEKLLNEKSDKYFLIDNNFSHYNFNYFYSYNHINTDFINELENKKIVYCSSSKKHIQVIKEQVLNKYPSKNILLICNDPVVRINDVEYNKEEFIENLASNITKHNVDLFLYSPTITTGVSIEIEYFNKVYAIGYNYHCPIARSFIQMFFRVRILIDQTINITTLPSLHFNKYNNKSYEKYITIRETQLLKSKYSKIENIDEDFNELRIINTKELCFSERAFIQDIYTRFKHHGIKINNIYKDTNKSFFKEFKEASDIVKQQKLLELKEVELINNDECDDLKHKEDITYEEKLKITKFFLLKNVSQKTIDNVLDTDKELELYEILLKSNDLLRYTKDIYKYDKPNLDYNSELQHLTNTDAKQLELKSIMNILKLFKVDKDFTARYTNKELKDIIDTNKDFIQCNFNDYQIIFNVENKIDFLKSTDLFRDTKLFLRSIKDYGIRSGYLSSKNKKWNGREYVFNYNSINQDRQYTTFYITLELNNFIKYNKYQDILPTKLIKLTEFNKQYKLHDYRDNEFENVIDKKLIKATKNRITINKKQIYQKSYNEELLYPSTQTNYKATDVSTELEFKILKSNYVKLKLNFNNIYTKQTNTNILTNKILPTIEPIDTSFNDAFELVMTELSSVYGVINSNKINVKNLINDENNTNGVDYDVNECGVLKNYYTSIKLFYREQFLQEKHKDKDDENYIEYDTDYNKDYYELSSKVLYFDWILELLSVIEPQENYKHKHTSYNDACMVFKNNSRIVRIEYERIN